MKTSTSFKKGHIGYKANLGKKFSEEYRHKLSIAHKDQRPTEEQKRKIGNFFRGKKWSEERKRKFSQTVTGIKHKPLTKEHRTKISIKNKGKFVGIQHWNWKGGITSERKILYFSKEYKLWRTAVFERDNYTCIWCGQVGRELNADHIKPWADYPELRFAIDNGRTLCISCHRKTDTWGVHKK